MIKLANAYESLDEVFISGRLERSDVILEDTEPGRGFFMAEPHERGKELSWPSNACYTGHISLTAEAQKVFNGHSLQSARKTSATFHKSFPVGGYSGRNTYDSKMRALEKVNAGVVEWSKNQKDTDIEDHIAKFLYDLNADIQERNGRLARNIFTAYRDGEYQSPDVLTLQAEEATIAASLQAVRAKLHDARTSEVRGSVATDKRLAEELRAEVLEHANAWNGQKDSRIW